MALELLVDEEVHERLLVDGSKCVEGLETGSGEKLRKKVDVRHVDHR